MGFLDPPDRLEDAYRDPYTTWSRNPSKANTSKLLTSISPDIDKGISAHVGYTTPMLRSRARQIALKAVRSYDPSKAKLGTHIVNQLQGLRRIARKQTQILPEPERVAIDRTFIEQARNKFLDESGYEPSARELADATGLSQKRIKHVQSFRHAIAESTLSGMNDEGEMASFDPAIERQGSTAWLEFVYDDLDDTNQKIMDWTLGLHGQKELSNRQIAAKLRLSPGAISQRKAYIQSILAQEQELSPFYNG